MTTEPRYLFLDLETPGVEDFDRDRIFEIAVILTDRELEEIARFETVIQPTPESLQRLHANPVVLEMHRRSGLYDVLMDAEGLPTMREAEAAVLSLLDEHAPGLKLCISGSGVARFDHPVLNVQMPRLASRLVYWEQDPASARRLFLEATGRHIVTPKAEKTHRAMADIEDDLRYVRAFFDLYRREGGAAQSTPRERTLTAVALTQAFMGHDSFLLNDGTEVATTGTAEVVASLMHGKSSLEVIAGFMDLTERLVHALSETNGRAPLDILDAWEAGYMSAEWPGDDAPHVGHVMHLTGAWYCDTCESPYCERA